MKTMEKLIKRFNRLMDPEMSAELDWINSYQGWYTVVITDGCGLPGRYHFRTCKEFREWMDGVVID